MSRFIAQNRQAEAATLACTFGSEEAARRVAALPECLFTTGKHRNILRAIKALVDSDQTVEPIFLKQPLEAAGKWDDSSNGQSDRVSLQDLLSLEELHAVPSQVNAYIRLMQQAHRQRQICQQVEKIRDQASQRFLTEEELAALEENFQQAAFEISVGDHTRRDGPATLKRVMSETFQALADRYDGRTSRYGIRTGFEKLDRYTTGFHPGELVIVCGRPGMGKTALALDVALSAVHETPVALFSLEMSSEQIGQRLLAKRAAVNIRSIRSGTLEEYEWKKVVTAMGDLTDFLLYVDDTSTLSPAQIRSRVREISVRTKASVGLVIVDYLQILSPSRRIEHREQQISSISREMKRIAKDLSCPVILLSQLNRDLERRADKRPTLADLRESGAIEQDADCVIGLYQPFVYSDKDDERGKAEAIILKQRNGPIGTIDLRWVPETATFLNP